MSEVRRLEGKKANDIKRNNGLSKPHKDCVNWIHNLDGKGGEDVLSDLFYPHKKASQTLLMSEAFRSLVMLKFIKLLETKIEEIWKDVVGYEGKYAVSTIGRIKNSSTGRILKLYYDRLGYVRMTLANGRTGDFTKAYLHRLILIAFDIPNPDNKTQVNHKNGNPSDNKINNLEWCTPLENIRHSLITGLHATGKGQVFLNGDKVKEIRSKHKPKTKGSLNALAKEYGLKRKHLDKIIYNEIWRYV